MITHWFERKYDSAVNHMLTPFKHLDPVKHVWKILDWHIKTVLTIKQGVSLERTVLHPCSRVQGLRGQRFAVHTDVSGPTHY